MPAPSIALVLNTPSNPSRRASDSSDACSGCIPRSTRVATINFLNGSEFGLSRSHDAVLVSSRQSALPPGQQAQGPPRTHAVLAHPHLAGSQGTVHAAFH